jgi:hypothetical protein
VLRASTGSARALWRNARESLLVPAASGGHLLLFGWIIFAVLERTDDLPRFLSPILVRSSIGRDLRAIRRFRIACLELDSRSPKQRQPRPLSFITGETEVGLTLYHSDRGGRAGLISRFLAGNAGAFRHRARQRE